MAQHLGRARAAGNLLPLFSGARYQFIVYSVYPGIFQPPVRVSVRSGTLAHGLNDQRLSIGGITTDAIIVTFANSGVEARVTAGQARTKAFQLLTFIKRQRGQYTTAETRKPDLRFHDNVGNGYKMDSSGFLHVSAIVFKDPPRSSTL